VIKEKLQIYWRENTDYCTLQTSCNYLRPIFSNPLSRQMDYYLFKTQNSQGVSANISAYIIEVEGYISNLNYNSDEGDTFPDTS